MALIGIKINHEIVRTLKNLDVPGNRTQDDEYHITIACFEDDVTMETILKAIKSAYDIVNNTKPFLISTEEITCFPKRENNPCAIIAKVNSEELHKLNNKIKSAFDEDEVEYSKLFKDYKPHITLSYHDEEIKSSKIEPVEFMVHEIVIFGGNNGDDKFCVTIPLKSSEYKKHSNLINKLDNFNKLAKCL